MQKFVYPRDYLDNRGNIHDCWRVHVKKMKEHGLPYVDYFSFYNRLKRYHWDLYRAIHTPRNGSRRGTWDRFKMWLRTQRFRFIYLFKSDDRRGRSKRH